jgi:protein-export membrane protein, SecD/SecF family
MIITYGIFGIIANIALVMNMTLIIAILSLLQATLTLPGIAGIVLTIGMAVDANVLIFERIREEFKIRKNKFDSVDEGFKKAVSTIIDANLTTFIAAFALFVFGSGPIKGFSVTLMIGLVTSMYTAIVLTRFLIIKYISRG